MNTPERTKDIIVFTEETAAANGARRNTDEQFTPSTARCQKSKPLKELQRGH